MSNKRNIMLPFLIGSSYPAILITFLYTGIAFRLSGHPSDVPFEEMAWIVPPLIGCAAVIAKSEGEKLY